MKHTIALLIFATSLSAVEVTIFSTQVVPQPVVVVQPQPVVQYTLINGVAYPIVQPQPMVYMVQPQQQVVYVQPHHPHHHHNVSFGVTPIITLEVRH
jgi:hypothetical protein